MRTEVCANALRSILFRCVYLKEELDGFMMVNFVFSSFQFMLFSCELFSCQVEFDQRSFVEEEMMGPRMRTREF